MADIVRWFPNVSYIEYIVILSISSWEFNIVILTENSNGFGNWMELGSRLWHGKAAFDSAMASESQYTSTMANYSEL